MSRTSMFRAFLIGTALATGLALAPAFAETLRLRAEVEVDGDTIRLGHLIEGLEKGGETPLFRAPAPGSRGTIRVDRVLAAAREMGIDRVETGAVRAVSIQRRGRTISRTDLQDLIARTLAERGVKGNLDVTLDDYISARTLDISRTEALKVTSLARDPVTGRFEAKVTLAGDVTGETWTLAGAIIETRDVVVPAADIERGEALQAKDLILTRRPASQVNGDIATQIAELVGMVPRKALRTGEIIRQSDLAKPILVEKNQLVTVSYISKSMTLQMRGRAQNAGAMGETVRVQNPQSKRIVEGIVSGAAQITISAPPATPATLADATGAVR